MTKRIMSGEYELHKYWIIRQDNDEWCVFSNVEEFSDGTFFTGDWEITFQTKKQCVEWIEKIGNQR